MRPSSSAQGISNDPLLPAFAPGLSVRTTRILTAVALAAAPAAVLIRALGPGTTDGSPHEIASLVVMIASLLVASAVFGSRLHRIAGDKARKLDEMELQLRHGALATSYVALTAIVMLGAIYAQIASMAQLWLPAHRSDWNPIFVCLFLYAMLLPTAVLAWRMEEEGEEG